MAMAELARHGAAQGDAAKALPLSQISETQRLPLPYLEQLFLALRRAGLVESARGRSGGYRLARTPADITIADVMAAVEEETHFTRCNDETAGGCIKGERCLTHELWKGLTEATAGYLNSVTLDALVAGRLPDSAVVATKREPQPQRVYLDYNATAPMLPEAKAAMIAAFDVTGNPSSVHAEGRKVRGIVETAREQVAALIGAKPSEIVFTSGASEANAWALSQLFDTIFVSGIEHDSVLANARHSKANIIDIPAGSDGVAKIEEVARHWLTRTDIGKRVAVALQMANNETGVVQPVVELAEFAREHGMFMHTDAVQAAGRIAIDFASLPVTTLAISAHKFGGPEGIGALVIRDHVDLEPLIRGGGQERRRRAGTENVAAIAGFGAAAEAARARLLAMPKLEAMRDRFETELLRIAPGAVIVGRGAPRLANTSCVAFPGRSAESLLIKLDLAGISISAGAACSSGKVGVSHVLSAMGLDERIAKSAIRVSLGPDTRDDELAALLGALAKITSQPALAA